MFTAYHGSEVKNILFIHSKCLWYSLLGACYAKLTTSTFSSIKGLRVDFHAVFAGHISNACKIVKILKNQYVGG